MVQFVVLAVLVTGAATATTIGTEKLRRHAARNPAGEMEQFAFPAQAQVVILAATATPIGTVKLQMPAAGNRVGEGAHYALQALVATTVAKDPNFGFCKVGDVGPLVLIASNLIS